MSKLHTALHLQHHRHTGKLLHHRHTSYRGLAIVFVLTGSLMLGINLLERVAADSLSVYGTLSVPAPTTAPTITTPTDNTTIYSNETVVGGSCPLTSPQPVVVMTVDGITTGSAACDNNSTFTIPVTITAGPHRLVAVAYSVTGDKGAASTATQLTYQAKTNTLAPSQPTITTTQPFNYLGSDRTVTWTGTIAGATPPYHVRVAWGDGSQDTYTLQPGIQHLSHHYATLASYNITVPMSDAQGVFTTSQFAAAAYTSPSTATATTASNSRSTSTTVGLYGLFVTLLAVCAIIWLEAKHNARHTTAPSL